MGNLDIIHESEGNYEHIRKAMTDGYSNLSESDHAALSKAYDFCKDTDIVTLDAYVNILK